ncbi:SpoIIE family protein phosphatase [Streptomyces sp. GC420]|uniref:ATP-binding SpoIIE family protein phosphatase n=1 Tax=Streptomyces sp. GC420 TaxID=2697568 RepID=UPI001414D50E|nr:SpoIIE family protein phosphatase [Streptomyces sp. GC420]NBM16912.1 SpoIIE family protein phosphatase [Streptomyces sp. GC420]
MTDERRPRAALTALAEEPVALVLDANGRVLTATGPALRLLGRPIDELRHQGIWKFFEDPEVWTDLALGVLGAPVLSSRATLRRPDGTLIETAASAAPLAEGTAGSFLLRLLPLERDEMALADSGPRTVERERPTGTELLAADPQAMRRLKLLGEAAARIGGSLDITRNAEQLLDVLVPDFADLGAVDLTETVLLGEEPPGFPAGTRMQRVAVAAADGRWPPDIFQLGDRYRIRKVPRDHLARGAAGALSDLATTRSVLQDDEHAAKLLLPPGATSYLALPLMARDTVLAGVSLWRTDDRKPFDRSDMVLADEIGTRAALSLDNARRYTLERRTAEALQRSLLPQPVMDLVAAETSGTYAPASTVHGIGGSWFDVIPLSSCRVAFVVGNTSGRGLGATATMGRLRAAVQTLADLDLNPDELLSHLDDLVIRFAEDEQHRSMNAHDRGGAVGATCLYAVYDPVTCRFVMASAGHPPPLLAPLGSDGTQSVPCRPGPPLGVGAEPFEPAELRMRPGDMLSFYAGALAQDSDAARSLLSTVRDGTREGASSGRPVTDTGDRIRNELLHEPPEDDLALLVARVRGLPPDTTASWELPADPSVVGRARTLVSEQLSSWGLEGALFTTELIVSELVTNSIRYAGGPVGLRLIRDQDQRLVCEVSDPSQTQPHLRRARLTDEGGRGLFLVAQLTHRWGSRYTSDGKTIWTEQLLEGGP